MMRMVAFMGLVLALSAPALPVLAEETGEQARLTVGAVDFNDPAQVRALHERLVKAAGKVCDVPGDSIEIREENARCRDRAMSDAVRKIGRPELARVHENAARVTLVRTVSNQ